MTQRNRRSRRSRRTLISLVGLGLLTVAGVVLSGVGSGRELTVVATSGGWAYSEETDPDGEFVQGKPQTAQLPARTGTRATTGNDELTITVLTAGPGGALIHLDAQMVPSDGSMLHDRRQIFWVPDTSSISFFTPSADAGTTYEVHLSGR